MQKVYYFNRFDINYSTGCSCLDNTHLSSVLLVHQDLRIIRRDVREHDIVGRLLQASLVENYPIVI